MSEPRLNAEATAVGLICNFPFSGGDREGGGLARFAQKLYEVVYRIPDKVWTAANMAWIGLSEGKPSRTMAGAGLGKEWNGDKAEKLLQNCAEWILPAVSAVKPNQATKSYHTGSEIGLLR